MTFPNVIFVGAEKSGSTTIHNILSDHKDVFSIRKETEFFSFYNKNKVRDYHINDISSYKKLFAESKNYKIKLDVSTTYLCSPYAINNIKDFVIIVKLLFVLEIQ